MLRLRECRLKAGLTQLEVAKFLGITETGYGNWEREYRDINLKDAVKLATIFKCSLDDLIGSDDYDDAEEFVLTDDECELIRLYRSTDARGKRSIMAVAESQRGDNSIRKVKTANEGA